MLCCVAGCRQEHVGKAVTWRAWLLWWSLAGGHVHPQVKVSNSYK